MKKKEDLLKELRENEMFKELLAAAPDEKERKAIKIHTENFLSHFFKNVIDPIQQMVEKDPEIIEKTLSKIQTELINNNSGSI